MQNVDKNTFLSINLNAINKNYNIIKKKVGERCIIAATVKADAYGLGAEKVVPSLIRKFENKIKIEVWGNGKDIKDFIYIEDFVEIVLKLSKMNCHDLTLSQQI